MHEKRFQGNVDRLRSPERIERLSVSRVVEESLAGVECDSVLDVGTGSGLFAESFHAMGKRIAGIDANPQMTAAASGHLPDATFTVATAEALPFPDESFDLVFLGLVFHETDEPEQALAESVRVARRRVAILEWPHRIQDFGPPLEHRVSPEFLDGLLARASLPPLRRIELENVDLFLIDK